MARLMPIQQLAINTPETTNLSFKEIAVIKDGAKKIMMNTNTMAINA
jgi:hypothetical protein